MGALRSAALISTVALVLARPTAAHAVEREWHLGGDLGAGFVFDGRSQPGALVGIHGAYGVLDWLDVKASALSSGHPFDDSRFDIYSVSGGVALRYDVIQLVPWAGIQLGYYPVEGARRPEGLGGDQAGVSLDVGADYAISRTFSVGLGVRYHALLGDPPASLADVPYLTTALRLESRWGF